jgi:hypothetical protein
LDVKPSMVSVSIASMAKCQIALRVGALLMTLCLALPAHADGRTTFLIDRLKSDDFRVRTNAALALGATNDDAAVQPLCGALNDGSDVVRIAAAAALKRLGKPAAVPCLRQRLSQEGSAGVKTQLQSSIDALAGGGGGGGGGSPPTVGNAKFYVSIALGTNNSGHDSGRIINVITSKLDSLGGYQLAPRAESPDAARAVISRRNLKGYQLTVSVELSDTGGGVKAQVRIAVASYPGRDLRGEVAPSATAPGMRRGDQGAEDSLLTAVAERAAEQFSQNFQ